jgi:hypothetical protein
MEPGRISMSTSYATLRKLRIIEEKHGPNWAEKFPGRSIDSVFIELTGDRRKNLFCKIRPDLKQKLDEMVEFKQVNMAEMIEQIIEDTYEVFLREKSSTVKDLSQQYS